MVSSNRQLFLNLSTNFISYFLNFGVTFFLTPLIVLKLGTSSYGFVGLSNNIIGYTLIFTVALNSMSSRYVAINYHRDKKEEARGYLSSTFFSNLVYSMVITIVLGGLVVFLDEILNIPPALVSDVKFLFVLLIINTIISLAGGVLGISTFVKNCVDKSNIRNMVGTIIRSSLLILLFFAFKPRLWYFGISAIVMSLYVLASNYYFFKTLTPDLHLSIKNFELNKVIELVKSGIWNVVSSLSSMINEGFDLLIANLFISPVAMGLLSITKPLPNYISSLVISLSSSFHPEYAKLYSEGNRELLKASILKSIRILSCLTIIPISIIFAYGDIFFHNWMPNEDTDILYGLSSIGCVLLMFSLPYQGIWYVFILDDKLKRTSINALANSCCTFIIVLISMIFVDNIIARLIILVGTRTILSSFRCLTFLPLYASRVMGYSKNTFYRPIIENLFGVLILTMISLMFKYLCLENSWIGFFMGCMFTAFAGAYLGWIVVLNATDREYLIVKVKQRVNYLNRI